VSNVELLGGGNKEPGQQTTTSTINEEVPIGGDDSLPF
jgi:hypothetical protein